MQIDGKHLTLNQVWDVAHSDVHVELSAKAKKAMMASRKFIESKLKEKDAIYGVNTGFGSLSQVKIKPAFLDKLQINLLRSHAVGIGTPLPIAEVRAAILLRANTLAQGHSGVTVKLVESLLELLNRKIHPYIPEQGSVGACGDLAPLAHLSLTLIGEGKCFYKGKLVPSAQALKEAGLKPYKLQAKEGLSLINGTQIMTAIGVLTVLKAERLALLADLAGAMTIEAVMGSEIPFSAEIQNVRPHAGQAVVAANMRKLLANSEIMKSHENCGRVQDPYSIRCIPQVHGVVRDTIKQVKKTLAIEINSVTDNPMIFLKGTKGKILTGGNFHGEYVAMNMDHLCMALSELANISERRLEKLINPTFSSLPAFLVRESGLNSGFMIVQVAAASLVSENKVLSHPAVVDSIPTSTDKEDHVSMGTISARKARQILNNSWNVIAMELFAASQGLEFRKPLKPAKKVLKAYQAIRNAVPSVEEDRVFADDIQKISELMDRKLL